MRKLYFLLLSLFMGSLLQAQTVYQIGNGTATNTATGVPSPLQDWFNNTRQQILIRASELSAAGMPAGNITKIGFNVVTLNSFDISEQYKIYMKNTTSTVVGSTFETGATQVFGPVDVAVTANGIFEMTLSTPFNWDGTSNLLIEICQGQFAVDMYTQNASTTYTVTSFNSYSSYREDYIDACPATTATVSANRPNVYLTGPNASGCTGTPSAGTISGPSTACSGVNFTLSATGVTVGQAGLRYAWQSSPNNTTWTNIPGQANPTSATVSQTAPTFYRLVDTCTNSGGTAISNVIQVTMSASTSCYCIPVYTTGCTLNDRIANFVFNTISNNSGTACQSTSPLGYTVYPASSFTTSLAQGASYNASIIIGGGGDAGVVIWIDFNDNGVFEDIEKSFTPGVIASSGTGNITVSIPQSAPLGQHRMRVRLVYDEESASIDACSSFTYGETEDYTISIIANTACAGTPGGGTSTVNPAIMCGPGKVYLNNAGAGPGSGLAFQWQSSPDSTTWMNIQGITGVPDSTNISATTFFRLVVTCTNSGLSANSAGVKATVTTVPPNDAVCNAITLTIGGPSDSQNTLCATVSSDSIPNCSSPNNTTWYRFTPAINGTVLVRTVIPTGSPAPLNGWLAWFAGSGSCPSLSLTQVGNCSQFGFATAGRIDTLVSPSLTAGTTYYIMIDGFSGSAGEYSISIINTPTPPASCATNTFPANGASGIATPATFSWTPVSGASSYTFFLGTNNPPTAADSITTVTTNSVTIIGGLPNTTYYWYVIPKNFGGAASGCISTVTSFTTAGLPVNDQCGNAIPLTVNNGFCTTPVLGTLSFADSTTGLGTASCTSLALKNDVWYTITVQPGKKVVVQTSAINTIVTDLVMQAYTGICGSLIANACNDEGNPEPAPSSSHARLLLGNTGTVDSTYYIRIMPYSSATNMGAFAICAWDTAAPALRNVSQGTPNSCVTGTTVMVDSLRANLYMWVPLYDGSGNVIGEIYPNGNVLGNVSSALYVNSGAVRTYNGQYYLNRNITITTANQPSAANKVRVRLYFTNAELTAFQSVVPSATRSNLVSTKVATGCVAAYTPTAPVLERAASNNVYRTNDHYIQLDTISSFSTFFIHTSAALAPLPANLVTFSGVRQGNANQLKWTVAQEVDVKWYEVERSDNGRSWSKVGSVNSSGNTASQRSYNFTDNNISGLKQMYRLRQVDRNGSERLSNTIIILGVKPTVLTLSGLFPNPTTSKINVLIDAPSKDNVTLVVMDVVGRVVKSQKAYVEVGANTLQLNVTGLAQGSYLLKVTCESSCETAISKFVKE